MVWNSNWRRNPISELAFDLSMPVEITEESTLYDAMSEAMFVTSTTKMPVVDLEEVALVAFDESRFLLSKSNSAAIPSLFGGAYSAPFESIDTLILNNCVPKNTSDWRFSFVLPV